MAKTRDSQMEAVRRYIRNNFWQMRVYVPKEKKEEVKEAAASRNESVNQFALGAIFDKIENI